MTARVARPTPEENTRYRRLSIVGKKHTWRSIVGSWGSSNAGGRSGNGGTTVMADERCELRRLRQNTNGEMASDA
jgi:hypothetical protein